MDFFHQAYSSKASLGFAEAVGKSCAIRQSAVISDSPSLRRPYEELLCSWCHVQSLQYCNDTRDQSWARIMSLRDLVHTQPHTGSQPLLEDQRLL